MDTFFQLVALLASGIVIAMYGWSALAVRRWVELVPNGLLSGFGGALVSILLWGLDVLSEETFWAFAILIPAISLMLGLAALMANWTINPDETNKAEAAPETPIPWGPPKPDGPDQAQEVLVPNRLFGMSVMTVSSHLTLAMLLATLLFIGLSW